MEEPHRPENNVKKHLAKLHEKIQHKYLEMQKKLEKSKSVDSISNLSDDFSHKDLRYGSVGDLDESDEVFANSVEIKTETLDVESDHRQIAVSQDVEFVEASFAEIEDKNQYGDWERSDSYSIDTRTTISLESLNDISKDSDDSSKLTPPPKTIRQKIESRIIAARERRREEKEKHAKERQEKMEKLILTNSKQDTPKTHRKIKQATVTLALIEATGLESVTDGKERLLLCRFRLGTEKGKSKMIRSSSSEAKWQELFNIHMFEDHMLELTCFDQKMFIGRNMLDVSELDREKTHKLTLDLSGGEMSGVKLFVLVTVTGIPLLDSLIGIEDFGDGQKKVLPRTLEHDVGWLSVVVYGAKGLSAHDCYCVLKLANERVQTHVEYKTNDPNWMKFFQFHVNDITSIIEISVVDEKKGEEVGKISIPLLKINNGEKVWYALKDGTQRYRAKGNNPRILLEMKTNWYLLRASIRVINPKEEDFLQDKPKLDRRVFARNLSRSKTVVKWTLSTLKIVKTCFEWESRKWNAIALAMWIVFCYFFKIWMLPLLFLIPFVKYRPEKYYLINWKKFLRKKSSSEIKFVKIEKDEPKPTTIRQKINSLQEMVQSTQNAIGLVASYGESVKNLVNFTVPFVSILAAFLILSISFVMYIVPLKYILITWGIHKFTRKILRPNRIPNNEILDLLSRVPDDETLLDCEELPLELEPDEEEIMTENTK